MIRSSQFILAAGLLFIAGGTALAQDDVLTRGKSDTGIKPLRFPLSMKVIQSRPIKGAYYFYEEASKRFDEGLEGTPSDEGSDLDAIFTDAGIIKKTLVRVDPARVAPASQGKEFRGMLSREALHSLKKQYSENILFIFRHEIIVSPRSPWPRSPFLNPGLLLSPENPGYTLTLRSRGLLYLTRQDKVLSLPVTENRQSYFSGEGVDTKTRVEESLKKLVRENLQSLAGSAKREIQDKQFVIRRPTY